jgi:plasmid stability protein
MKETRNITFHLPADLIRRAKVRAAERDTSLNTLVREALIQVLDQSDDYRAAGERLLAPSAEGLFDMPVVRWSRAELYD